MKKLLALLALAITTTTYGQVSNEVGIVAGPNIHYRINNNADGMYSSGLGFTGGITNNLYFGSHSSIYAALMYERRTEVQTKFFFIDFPPYPTKAVFTDDYISVPILYRYTMGKKALTAFINAGPQFGFGYRHESRYYYDNQDPIWGPTNNVNNNLVTEISGVVGVGVKANLYEHFSVGLEYRQQFWLLSDNGQSTASIGDNYAPSYSTSNFLISAAYRFGKN